jgi:uncharacterized repeat protein (TIGR02543 family)
MTRTTARARTAFRRALAALLTLALVLTPVGLAPAYGAEGGDGGEVGIEETGDWGGLPSGPPTGIVSTSSSEQPQLELESVNRRSLNIIELRLWNRSYSEWLEVPGDWSTHKSSGNIRADVSCEVYESDGTTQVVASTVQGSSVHISSYYSATLDFRSAEDSPLSAAAKKVRLTFEDVSEGQEGFISFETFSRTFDVSAYDAAPGGDIVMGRWGIGSGGHWGDYFIAFTQRSGELSGVGQARFVIEGYAPRIDGYSTSYGGYDPGKRAYLYASLSRPGVFESVQLPLTLAQQGGTLTLALDLSGVQAQIGEGCTLTMEYMYLPYFTGTVTASAYFDDALACTGRLTSQDPAYSTSGTAWTKGGASGFVADIGISAAAIQNDLHYPSVAEGMAAILGTGDVTGKFGYIAESGIGSAVEEGHGWWRVASAAGCSVGAGGAVAPPEGGTGTRVTLSPAFLESLPSGDYLLRLHFVSGRSGATDFLDIPLRIQDAPAPAPCAVAFDSRGGSAVAGRTVAAGSAVGALPSTARTGHAFLGWFTAPSGGVRVTASTVVSGGATYYAQWRANTYTVRLDANGGRLAAKAASVKRTYGQALGKLAAKPTRTGYTFQGWFTGKAKGTKADAKTKVTRNLTYYAHWKASGPVVTLNANGGKVGKAATASVVKKRGAAVGRLATPTRTGYAFQGWFTGKAKGTKVTAKTKATRNITLYAHWKARAYAVKLDANGGKVAGKASASVKRAYNSKLGKLSTPKRTGYQFLGWYTAKSGGKKVGSTTKVTKSATYYAHWKRVR